MQIAIIGAGFAGLSSAKVLSQVGFEVTVYEKAPDVGGVWSATRRYPGVRTQNDKGTYALSDFPMPPDYPEWPSGEQVQRYLADYVRHVGLEPSLRLGTEVVSVRPAADGESWSVTTRDVTTGESDTRTFDRVVVANGIFSEPLVPAFPGLEEFTACGGRVCASSDFHDVAEAAGRDVVVVGYGKSSCDVSIPISDVAASTHLVARELLWKMPRRLGGVLNYKFLMLTRMGEGLFRYIRPRGFERFLHGPGDAVRRRLLSGVQAVATRQLRLRDLDLVPRGTFEDIARSTVSLATHGFYERVADGVITVHRDRVVARLLEDDGRPHVELSDGTLLPADLVVCGTGFRQVVPFLDEDLQRRITDERGNFVLYRQIKPIDVPGMYFAGYNSSFFSPLSAEMAAVWIAHDLLGDLLLPSPDDQRRHVDERLRWMEERTRGQHARGTNVIPFSMHNIDEVLSDVGVDVGPVTRALQWLLPIDPGSYRHVTAHLLATSDAARATAART
ncbi:NAD(P)/FAD-dependent oxidoreductase [Geodermatophilus sp. DSM 44513]|uniref:flavin-containing monooxygenase n=1 Tax=Geodermatophilus sp. DSM 44513 TaxID=1528104 RepID=UPI001279079D|nr:NAD(P)/FAD-dependent oxidoreductase [Geodermatophilus sp. DSM 44513]WNV77053.1 NAD(P)/FAD-dependent oxidoreductase [Geodermatophilus sp. DSM 44513]